MNAAQIVKELSLLGQMYHTYFGFRNNEPYTPGETFITITFDNKSRKLFHQAFVCNRPVYLGDNIEEDDFIESEDDLIDGETYTIVFQTIYVEARAQTVLPYDRIVIKYEGDVKKIWGTDFSMLDVDGAWYNKPSKFFKRRKQNILPFLSSRPYIEVEQLFMKVNIYRSEDDFLTYDDILFATRALAADETRTYDRFIVLSEDNNVLTLTVEMDNYSS